MVNDRQLVVLIDGQAVDTQNDDESPVTISYNLEDEDNFQNKRSAESFSLTLPATLNNDRVANTFHNPDVEDTSTGSYYRNPRPCTVIANGIEIFKGKALLQSGSRSDLPEKYVYDCLAQNGDWLIDLQDKTLWDFVNANTHLFTQSVAEASWNFDGTNVNQDFVYAPVRYKKQFASSDLYVTMLHLRPSLFIWPIIYRAFQSIGYTIKSDFMNTTYFRRLVMPWVWGNFLQIDSSKVDILKFLATGRNPVTGNRTYNNQWSRGSGSGNYYIKLGVGSQVATFSLDNTATTPGYDNNNNYSYNDGAGEYSWTYNQYGVNGFGTINARFGVSADGGVSVDYNSDASIYCEVYKNTVLQFNQVLFTAHAGATQQGIEDVSEAKVFNFTVKNLVPGDVVTIKFRQYYSISSLGAGSAFLHSSIQRTNPDGSPKVGGTTFQLFGISIALGGIVDFKQYQKFKDFKVLDLLRGLCDAFDLVPQTDSVSKVVYWEPAYPVILNDGTGSGSRGYFDSGKRLDWNSKLDLQQENVMESYSDNLREQFFLFMDDTADGGVSKYNARYNLQAGSAKYLFPQRFKTGKNPVKNRFFSPVVHFKASQWANITTAKISTQIIVLVPENISNTSADEAENNLSPKLAYYKGLVPRDTSGGWWWYPDPDNPGTSVPDTPAYYPYMFAVNYRPDGVNDPILAYNDQNIPDGSGTPVLGRGLMKRFFLQRLAIQDHGKRYNPFIRLNNNDATNWLHREHIQIQGGEYNLVSIQNYDPLKDDSIKCTMWKFIPVQQRNINACYPSSTSILTAPANLSADDILYQPLLLLKSDII